MSVYAILVSILLCANRIQLTVAYDIEFTSPMRDQIYSAGSTVNFSFVWTVSAPSQTRVDIYLLPELSTSIAETVARNHDINVREFSYMIPSYVVGRFWLALTRAGTYGIYAVHPLRTSRWGDNTFEISLASCNNMTGAVSGHSFCATNEYCDRDGDCFDCAFCASTLDAFDGYCPSKCGGSQGYDIGDRIPNVTETEASGGLRDVIAVGSPDYALLVNNVNPAIHFEEDLLGISHLMTSRLHAKLDLLVSLMQDATAVFGTDSPLLNVSRAYRFPPMPAGTIPAAVSLHNEARAARLSLGAGVQGNLSELMRFAQAAGFDWVHYADAWHLHVSVTQDGCPAPLDLMFLLDASGSIDIPRFGGRPGNFQNKVCACQYVLVGVLRHVRGFPRRRTTTTCQTPLSTPLQNLENRIESAVRVR